ncbi:Gfo/Idh/MocA family protein [Halorussus salinisoli]|uniref:Gfo/Idh/MocA family protein n=1 Tax=Halorussus salinisoli TaxID=2558242 RepID=UPI002A910E90|nr:Gfo/Idh/MocA family oxidoreductase [Halorussus salinisoli]
MTSYNIGFVGTGSDPENPDETGFAMAYRHAKAYQEHPDCRLEACADIVPENAEAFSDTFEIADDEVYEDYEKMLTEAEPDIVSVCVPPAIHADIVLGCIRSGVPDAVHCEKPMADTWDDCRQMVEEAAETGIQLTFNHQRRFGEPFLKAKELLDDGAIGELQRVEFTAANVFDYGSHSFDLCNYFNDEAEPEWVIGQIDYSEQNILFGAHNENQAVVHWQYENGVHGFAATGQGTETELVDCHNRLVGTDGVIEIGVGFCGDHRGPTLRVKRNGSAGWETIETEEDIHGQKDIAGFGKGQVVHDRAIANVVGGLDGEEPSVLSGENALRSTGLIFGCWESARRRGRVEFPLDIDDNPLDAMVETGEMNPTSAKK